MNTTNSEFSGFSQRQFTQVLQLFSFIIPTQFGIASDIHQHIVRQSMTLGGPSALTLEQIKSSIKKKLGLQFEIFEIKDAIETLREKGEITSLAEGEEYQLTPKVYQEWTEKNDAKEKSRLKIIDDWAKEGLRAHFLSDREVSRLKSDLQTYTAKLLEMHGTECTALLYPEKREVKEFLKEVSAGILSALPIKNRSKRIISIRALEIPRFFEEATPERKEYIAELLDSTFIYHILHLDPTCSQIIKKQLTGITIYLDTNFLYRLFGFHGVYAQNAVSRVLTVSRQMGMKLLVAEKTVEEYRNALTRDINKLKTYARTYGLPTKKLAEIGGTLSGQDNFITAYWRKYSRRPISIDDFADIYRQVEKLLQEKKIQIDYKAKSLIEGDPGLKVETAHLFAFIAEHNKAFPERMIRKVDPQVEHDAYVHFLTNKKREFKPRDFTAAKAWLLTCDRTLTLYDYYLKLKGVEKEDTINTCIMAHQWLQILRPLLPRAKDYDAAFADLLCSPYLRTYGSISSRISAEVLNKAEEVSKFPPQVALQLLTDVYFARQIALAVNEEEQQVILQEATRKANHQVKNQYVELSTRLSAEIENLQSQVDDVLEELDNERKEYKRREKDFRKMKKILSTISLLLATIVLFYIGYAIAPKYLAMRIPSWILPLLAAAAAIIALVRFGYSAYIFIRDRKSETHKSRSI